MNFSHKSIRRVILAGCRDRKQMHRDIYRYLIELEFEDAVWQTETAWHILEAGDERAFLDYIAEGNKKGVRYLERYRDCPPYADLNLLEWRRWAGQELYRHSMQDGGRLVLDMVKTVMDEGSNNGADENLLKFLYSIIDQCRQPSSHGRENWPRLSWRCRFRHIRPEG